MRLLGSKNSGHIRTEARNAPKSHLRKDRRLSDQFLDSLIGPRIIPKPICSANNRLSKPYPASRRSFPCIASRAFKPSPGSISLSKTTARHQTRREGWNEYLGNLVCKDWRTGSASIKSNGRESSKIEGNKNSLRLIRASPSSKINYKIFRISHSMRIWSTLEAASGRTHCETTRK